MGVFQFAFPELGEGIHEGKVAKWIVHEGDYVREDEPLAEVENDKAVVEIPSPVEGKVVQLFFSEGAVASVGEPFVSFETDAVTSDANEEVPKTPLEDAGFATTVHEVKQAEAIEVSGTRTSPAGHTNQSAVATPDIAATPERVLAIPSVRRLARENGIAIEEVKGTGEHGKITREDVFAHLANQDRDNPAISKSENVELPAKEAVTKLVFDTAQEEIVPLSSIRRSIMQAMVKSKFSAPHVTMMDEVDVTELVSFRNEMKQVAAARDVKLTFLPFIVKALIAALKKYPYLNAELDEENGQIKLKKEYHIGIATDTDRGLLVPVLHHANHMSMWELAEQITALSAKARTGKIKLEEMRGSTASISNIGSAKGLFFPPILNYPEVAILGVGRIRETLLRKDGEIVDAHMMALSLSFDHRVVDGAMAQLALNEIKAVLAEPKRMLMEV